MHFPYSKSQGFTLIEIISVLVVLGVLAAVAIPKYFDLQEDSDKKAALAAISEAQARIRLQFGRLILQGYGCEAASEQVNELGKLADSTEQGNLFGEYLLASDTITSEGVAVSARHMSSSGEYLATGARIYLPQCGEGAGYSSSGLAASMNDIATILHGFASNVGQSLRLDSGAVASTLDKTDPNFNADTYGSQATQAVKKLKEQGLDLAALNAAAWSYQQNKGNTSEGFLYWTPQNISSVAAGTKIPVLRYSTETGTYTVWAATVTTRETGVGKTSYQAIGSESQHYEASKTGTGFQTYENALKWFEAASTDTSWIK